MSFDIKSKPSIKYFQDNEEPNNKNDPTHKEKIQLIFNLINGIKNYSYSIKLESPENNIGNESFNSELKKCTDDKLLHLLTSKCDYIFGKEQKLKIEILAIEANQPKTFIINTTIGEIIGSENSRKLFDVGNNTELLEIIGQKSDTKDEYVTIHFELKIVSADSNMSVSKEQEEEYFKNKEYKIYFEVKKNDTKLYESETYTDDGKFNIVQIPKDLFNANQQIEIIFYNHKKHKIGTIFKDINELTKKKEKKELFFQKRLSLTENLNIYNVSSIKHKITFLDYINNGVKIALDIGIDFTGSNGDPDEEDSLHCRLPEMERKNPYERAISSCARIMANYDYDQLFPVYGFGAIIKGQTDVSNCFNINFKEDPNIQTVENIMKEYYSCLDKIFFAGPTNFAPIFNKIINDIRKESIIDYHVIMILTDGIIDDLEDTIDALVEGSFLPLSVIIVGIGDADFSKMVQLDGDDIPLVSRKGVKRQRDLVQFVPFNKFEGNEKKLTEEVLDEIPRQVIEYYTLNFLYPEELTKTSNKASINTNINDSKPPIELSMIESVIPGPTLGQSVQPNDHRYNP